MCGSAPLPLIFVLSGQPDPPLPSQVSAAQGHSLGYMGLAVTVGRALAGGVFCQSAAALQKKSYRTPPFLR